jgi:hypothetical protein
MVEDRRWRIEDGAILDPPFSILEGFFWTQEERGSESDG